MKRDWVEKKVCEEKERNVARNIPRSLPHSFRSLSYSLGQRARGASWSTK